ncbi:hypothetical protein EPUS_03779 [Endocarpon pusillum Z07020]|uniref:CENP-V/GFA domain-containing protein n=1 Tax=Endocarpon pusillum (strain Z07020 / HMAS-L-300199) TaxID=1263415 RepID=U1G9U4_ENDPU|nr:uncharacterized protein EPUS_03779 [Endocarpon pusillum Z07020]ERF68461.1 hypothetical protein EPUS_03779 [Endocarpon pusillum Z07020]
MPSGVSRPDFSHLSAYVSSPQVTRYFCPKCGAYVGNIEPDEWEFASGILNSTEGLLDRVQMWIEDTKDGGASIWLKKGHGTNPTRHLRDRKSSEATDSFIVDLSQNSKQQVSSTSRPPSLKGSCDCGAVSFFLQPPTPPSSSETTSTPQRYPAFLDACTSCRLTSGFEIACWIRAPQSHLFHASPNPSDASPSPSSKQDENPNLNYPLTPTNPSLLHYSSSPGVDRYSCKTCTASAFYVNDKNRGESVDVAMGLLRAESGARAEEWLDWKRGPEFAEEGTDAVFVAALEEGMRHLPEDETGA